MAGVARDILITRRVTLVRCGDERLLGSRLFAVGIFIYKL